MTLADTLLQLAENPWVTDMRRHFAEHGFYRASDLNRLLGSPGDSVTIGPDGKASYRRAQAANGDGR